MVAFAVFGYEVTVSGRHKGNNENTSPFIAQNDSPFVEGSAT